MKMYSGVTVSHSNIPLIAGEKVTRHCMSTNHKFYQRESEAEAVLNLCPFVYQPSILP